jgi:hypothetical protein
VIFEADVDGVLELVPSVQQLLLDLLEVLAFETDEGVDLAHLLQLVPVVLLRTLLAPVGTGDAQPVLVHLAECHCAHDEVVLGVEGVVVLLVVHEHHNPPFGFPGV